MGVYDYVNYVIYDNPISQNLKTIVTSAIGKSTASVPQTVTVITESKPLWKLAAEQGPYVRVAGLMGASAVAIGAYGAHKTYPKDRADELKQVFEAGSRFHFLNSLAMLGVPLCRHPYVSGALFILGTTLFSGACYYHALTGCDKFGRFAPMGGTILIFAWLSMAW